MMAFVWRDVGKLWEIDAEGYILNDASLDKIVPPFQEVVAELRATYLKYLSNEIHSIYLRGSVARGQGVIGVSDLDSFAVTLADPATLDLSWCEKAAERLKRHSCVTGSGFDFEPYAGVIVKDNRFNEISLQLRVQSVCLYGENLIPTLPRFKLGVPVANCDICQIKPDIEEAIAEVRADPASANTEYWCRRIMKNMVRAGFSLVILDERAYTRDLRPCYEYFAKHFPAQSENMAWAVELAIEPVSDPATLLSFLNSFGAWLIDTADKWLDRYNPSRELALKLE